jgi:phosphate acetyltransferase
MSKNLYITSIEARSGKSAITLGVMEMLLRNIDKVAFFRPIIQDSVAGKKDNDIELIRQHYNLKIDYKDCFCYTVKEAQELIVQNKQEQLLDTILARYKELEINYDFVLCEGSDFESSTVAFEFDINSLIAENIGSPILLVCNAHNKAIDKLLGSVEMAVGSFEEKGLKVISVIVNRVLEEEAGKIKKALLESRYFKDRPLYLIPNEDALGKPTLTEIAEYLEAEVIYGEKYLNKQTKKYTIGAMQVVNFLKSVNEGSMVITPGDRIDILLGCIVAHQSSAMPNIAGIILTGGFQLEEHILKMIQGFQPPMPILSVKPNTYQTASKLDNIHSLLSQKTSSKISMALGLFEENVNIQELKKQIALAKTDRVTPKMFEFNLLKKAKANKQHIVLPEGKEDRILLASEILLARGIVDITLLGNEIDVKEKIKKLGLKLDKANIIDPSNNPYIEDFSNTYYELRKDKGITKENAKDIMSDVNFFGTMMIFKGLADGMVSGSIHTTAETIRPSFQIVKTKPGSTIVSSVFFMCLEDRVLVYGDCAVNPNPTSKELAEIAINSADTARAFGIEPKVAMLSYSTGDSGKGSEVEKVREATQMARSARPDLLIDGPLQYDAAVDKQVAKSKMPDSLVAGQATVFIFPDLNTGNNTYKAVQRSANAIAVGPVLQGLNKPVNDLSRGCLIPDIVNTVAITAIQAQAEKGMQ